VLELGPEGLTFFDADANLGVKQLQLRLHVDGRDWLVRHDTIHQSGDSWVGEAQVGAGLRVTTRVEPAPGPNALVIRHELHNTRSAPIWIASAATGCFAPGSAVLHGQGSWLGWDLRCCHTDHVRNEHYPHCLMEYPYFRMPPTQTVHLGRGEDQSFPAFFLKDMQGRRGIVFAAASQDVHYTTFELRKSAMVNGSVFDVFAIHHDPGQSGGLQVDAGRSLALDGVFIQITGDLAPEDAFVAYVDYLAGRRRFRGRHTPMLRQAMHCTWNYGVFADQSEASLLPTARFIAQHLPNIKWFLMDAGYLTGETATTFLDRFYPDANQHVNGQRWPRGIRGYTDELRRLGLRPGLWWSPTVVVPSRLHDEHPDWLLRNADGSLYLIGGKHAFLDYSHPEAVAFLDRTLAVILGQWGMDACKMDFWSQNFEDRHARVGRPQRTSVQLRNEFLALVRKHLPDDGVLLTCVATGMGNPFVGQWADSYRNTIDIGVGQWHEQINNCIWSLPTLGIEGRKTFLLNNDSVGIMADYPDHENEFRMTWSFMTMGMLETGGRMETWPPRWVAAMRKLTDRCDRGHRVRCPDDRAFTGVPLPEVLYVDYPPDSSTARAGVRQSLALFNWSDEPRIVSVLRRRLGHSGPVECENFWTGRRQRCDDAFISCTLDPRSAVLFDVLG
jgi:hypothetical protein